MKGSLHELEAVIGHRFGDRELLTRALTHYSHVYESLPLGSPRTVLRDNERLEFLGDAILGFVASEHLLQQFPDYSEGKLSERKAYLVSSTFLVEIAQRLQLGRFLFLGKGEEMSGGRHKKGMLADALEAIIAAVYLDSGIDDARRFIETHLLAPGLERTAPHATNRPDYKTVLQELARARSLPLPRYELVLESGPDHAKTFTIAARIGEEWSVTGEGSTKKTASQSAARQLYDRLSSLTPDSISTSPSV